MSEKQIMSNEDKPATVTKPSTPGYRYSPAVDIYETDEALVMKADMPGVDEQNLQVEFARGVLTLEGDFAIGEDSKSGYHRQFKLSDRIDAEAGEAELKNGVLTLRFPKAEAAKPTRIAVKTLH